MSVTACATVICRPLRANFEVPTAAIHSTSRRTGVQWSGTHPANRVLLDSGLDMAIFGPCFSVISYHNETINVFGAVPGMSSGSSSRMCDAHTVAKTRDGDEFILRYNYGIDHTHIRDQESLLLPLHIQLNGIYVDTTPLYVGGTQTVQNDSGSFPLLTNGVHTYYTGRKPTPDDLKYLPTITFTSDEPWDPGKLANVARAYSGQGGSATPIVGRRVSKKRKHPLPTIIKDAGSDPPTAKIKLTDIMSSKQNRKIWGGTVPYRTHIFVDNKWIPLQDPLVVDVKPAVTKEMIAYWKPILGYCSD